jgi:hypothetical protein
MTYYVTSYTNDEARLIVDTLRTTDASVAHIVAEVWEDRGLVVKSWEEE